MVTAVGFAIDDMLDFMPNAPVNLAVIGRFYRKGKSQKLTSQLCFEAVNIDFRNRQKATLLAKFKAKWGTVAELGAYADHGARKQFARLESVGSPMGQLDLSPRIRDTRLRGRSEDRLVERAQTQRSLAQVGAVELATDAQ
jgi:hypothetical protein